MHNGAGWAVIGEGAAHMTGGQALGRPVRISSTGKALERERERERHAMDGEDGDDGKTAAAISPRQAESSRREDSKRTLRGV